MTARRSDAAPAPERGGEGPCAEFPFRPEARAAFPHAGDSGMRLEIERKFLPAADGWRAAVSGSRLYRQGYLCADAARSVRVRIAGDAACLTIKGACSALARLEFEYPLPTEDAGLLLERLADKPLVEKIRHTVPYGGLIWEVDEFLGANQGLILAEVELASEDQDFARPDWVGREVSGDPRYYNANLAKHPYLSWKDRPEGAASQRPEIA
jgi:adenylate cyclase